ncbi:hypothetical protein AR687_24540 [Flavobacteriaceae bacterium CRH]|nr:hypothetical protein AR687_24540 [Flavobacteriaceae bacterium CRH]
MNYQNPELKSALQKIFKRASIDEVFRKICLKEPALAFKMVSEIESPEVSKLSFIENASDKVSNSSDEIFILPPFAASNSLERVTNTKFEDYENHGSEKAPSDYENHGSEKAPSDYENHGSEKAPSDYENHGSEKAPSDYENHGSEKAPSDYENHGSEKAPSDYENHGSEKKTSDYGHSGIKK